MTSGQRGASLVCKLGMYTSGATFAEACALVVGFDLGLERAGGVAIFLYAVMLAVALGLAIRAIRGADTEPNRSRSAVPSGWDRKA